MVARVLWLWLSIGWLTAAVVHSRLTTLCDTGGPCRCSFGKLTCDCTTSFLKEVVLKPSQLDFAVSSISVANCFHLHIASNALSGLVALQQVTLANLRQITLEEKAFNWTTRDRHHTGLVVNVTNCSVQQVPSYAFEGAIRDILLTDVNISRVNSYAFGSLGTDRIEFRKVNVIEMETQSFKKMSVNFLSLFESNFSTFPERMMTDVSVHEEVRFDTVRVNRLEKSSLRINSPRNFRLIKCTVGYVESNALEVITKGDVSIHENVFAHLESDAFAGITVDAIYLREAGKQDFVFENNTLIEFVRESLKVNTSGFDPRLDWIMINQTCSCDDATLWLDELQSVASKSLTDRMIYCMTLKPTSLADYQRLYCNLSRFNLLTVALCMAVAVISLCGIGLVVFCGVRKRAKKYINVPTARADLRAPEDHKPHMLVVPDGKTYRETELHVILEHADAVKTTNFVKGRNNSFTNG